MKLCEGKTVMVTGASRGVGKAIACAFAREGANLVLVTAPGSGDDLRQVSGPCSNRCMHATQPAARPRARRPALPGRPSKESSYNCKSVLPSIPLGSLRCRSPLQVEACCKSEGSPGCHCHCYEADLSEYNAIEELCKKCAGQTVDVLINNAGVFGSASCEEQGPLKGNPAEWEKMMRVNLMAPMHLTRRFAPGMVDKVSTLET